MLSPHELIESDSLFRRYFPCEVPLHFFPPILFKFSFSFFVRFVASFLSFFCGGFRFKGQRVPFAAFLCPSSGTFSVVSA